MERAFASFASLWPRRRTSQDGDRIELPSYETLLADRRGSGDSLRADDGKASGNATSRTSRRDRRSSPVLYLSLVAIGLLLGRYGLPARRNAGGLVYPSEANVWSEFGATGTEVRVGTKPTDLLDPCKRTLLLPWVRKLAFSDPRCTKRMN